MKYIVYKDPTEKEYIIVFPGDKTQPQHRDIANALGFDKEDIVAAGFFLEIGNRKVFSGESMSLNIKSRGHKDRDLYIEQSER